MRRLALVTAVLCTAIVAGAALAADAGSAALRLVPVARGFDSPVFVTQAPGEPQRLYVVEQSGRVRVVERGRIRATPFLDVRPLIVAGGEQGLLGLAFPADYARSRLVYVHYSARPSGATVVARYRVRAGRAVPSTRTTVLQVAQPYANHNGGHLAFGPDRRLWIGLGDGGAGGDPEDRAQNMDSLLGKMLRLDVRVAGAKPVIVALGLRNPWRYSFDRRTGDLWIGDVGQGTIEEIDRWERPGADLVNFGWDVYEGRSTFEEKDLGPGRLVQPVAQYDRGGGCSVTGGYVFRGTGVPRLAGRYVYGDYCSGNIWSLPVAGGESRRESVRLPGLSSFGEGLRGELYAVGHGGTIYRFAQ